MAFTSVIPPLTEVLNTNHGIQSLDEKHFTNIRQQQNISRIEHSPSPPIKRTTSAQSVVYNRQQQRYQKCIEYLQEQHEQVLSKLHQEVQDLKQENKKLHFKILVENQGGAASIVKNTLGNHVLKSTISEELLLQETIKDLKVKLDLSQDTIQHHQQTIKNLNKQLKMKRTPHPPKSPKSSTEATPPPLKNEHLEKDKLILALKEHNQALLQKLEEQQIMMKSFKSSNSTRRISAQEIKAIPSHGDSRILFNPTLPPLNTSSNKTSTPPFGNRGTILTPRSSRTDISRRTKSRSARLNNSEGSK